MKNAIAKVSSLSGEVFARTADGTLRRLRTGDSITEGETIVAGQNGRARLILADGREINIGPRESVAMNAEVAANPPPAAEDSAFFSRPREVRNLARALQEGENLDDLVDEEAPAAGLVGDGSEGHSFVEFLRISETIDSQNSYRIDAGDLGIPDLGAAPADVLDTVPLTLSAALDPASDSGILGDNITNDNTPGIIGTSKPGASITVTMPGTGEVLLTTAATDGSWRVEAGQALADGAQNISVVATDRTGNTLSTTVFVIIDTATPNDGQAPIVTIIEDANDDGFINASELNGDVDVRIAFTGSKVDIGDIIRVSDGSTRIEHVISTADQARGYVETRFAAPGNGETITVTADITDAAGNTSAPGSDSAMIDIDVPNSGQAPDVEITEDANNDGFINRAEASGPADVKVSFNKDKVDVGDTVRVSDGTTSKDFVVSASDKANGFVTTDFPLPSDGSTLTVTAHIFDPAGNRSATGADFAKVDLSTLLNLQLVITEDTNNDGFINASELNGSVGVDITLPTDAIAGDLITIHATGNPTRTITLIQPQINAGRLSIELDAPANGTNLEVSAQVTDAAGNKSNIATDAAVINTTPPSLTVQLAPASDSGTQGDNLTNDNTPALTGRSDPGTRITVVIPSTGEQLSTITDGNGNWQVTPTLPMPDGTSIVEVTATDSIGNSSNTTLPLTIDTTQFSGQAIAIREDANNDGFINAAELQGDIDVRVTIPNGAAVGDTLTVSATGNASRTITITAAQIATGFVDLAFTPTANNTDFIVNASIADAAGNTSGPVSDYARIQLSPPDAPIVSIVEDANGDGWINAAELQGNIDVRIGLPTGASDGDILLTTVNGVTQPAITLTAADIVNQYIALPGIANPGEGTTLTVTAQIRDTAGNLGSVGSNNARIDTLPPAVTARLDPTSDSGTQGDGITNDNTPTISGTGEAGASITVTLPTGETLKTTVANTGLWSVTPQQPLAEGPATIFVTASDVAGNAANTSVDLTIDTHIPNNKLAPAVTITEDANGDGFINRAEASGPADVRVSFNKDNVDVGDTVRISDGSSVRNIVISTADKANGFVTTDFPLPADGNTLNVSAYLFDTAGNESATGSASAIVDITNYTGLAIEITEDANNDGFINIAELKDNDIDVRITIPQGAAVGDTLTVTAVGNVDKVFTLTAAQIATGFIDTKFNPTSNNTDFKVTAAITDPAGNTAGPVEDSARLQLSAPAEPIVTILEDANNDGWINAAELQGNIDVSVTLPATAVAGNTLISTVNGVTQAPITLTQADIVKGSYALPGIPNPGEGTTLTVTAQIRDAAGNLGNVASDSATIDTRIPNGGQAPDVFITDDINNDGFINRAEASGPADVRVAFNRDLVNVGDTVRISDGTTTRNLVVTATDQANGFVTTDFPMPINGGTLTVTAFIFDPAGNQSATGTDFAKVDLSALLNLQLVITEDENNDGFINASELKGSIGVDLTLPIDAVAGDLLTIHATGNATQTITLNQAQIDTGKLQLEFNAPPNGTQFEASAQVTDAAGNKSNIATDAAVINTTPPTLTVQLAPSSDSGTKGDNITNDATPTLIGVTTPGARVTVNIPSTGEQLQTTADSNGNWQFTPTQAMPDGTTPVVATATDAIGNTSTTSLPLTIDTTQFTGLTVSIREDENNDGFINLNELKDGDIDVRVTLPDGAAVGDTLTVAASGNIAQVFTLSAAQLAAGFIDVTFTPTANNTDFIATASIVDAAGNSAGPVSDQARIQLSPPDAPIVTIIEDANNDGWINAAELQGDIDVRIELPGNVQAGDRLLTTVNGIARADILITQADIDQGSIALPGIANPGEGSTFTVTAQVRDSAGNFGSIGDSQARIDTTPPALAAWLDPTSDSGIQGDGITNDNTPTLSGTGEPGAAITVTLPGTGEVLKTTVSAGGTWTVTPTQPLADGAHVAQVGATDAAGNSSTATVALHIDTHIPNNRLAPTVIITEDANGDGYINRAEAIGNADVRVAFTADLVEVGDVVVVSAGGISREIAISSSDRNNGYVSTDFPMPANGATLTVSAFIVDRAGNTSDTGQASAIVDITDYQGLSIEITEDANNDGFINRSELQDNDIDVRVTLPNGAAIGDTLTITAVGNVDKVFTLTAAQLSAGFIDVKFNPTANNTDFRVTASIVDVAGNAAGPVEDTARIVISPPSEPIVTILEDINNDGWINAAELQGNIDVSVTLPATAVAGDTLLTSINGVAQAGITITHADILKGSIALPGIPNPGDGITLTVEARVKDAAGNIGNPGSDSATIDLAIPNNGEAPAVTILEDINNDGFINRAEASGNADVRIAFNPALVKAGDTVRVTDGTTSRDIVITPADQSKGYVDTDFPLPPDGTTLSVSAYLFDPAGNRSATGTDFAKVDLSALLNLQLVITEDENNDGFINASELKGSVGVDITLPTDAIAGDLITITATGNPTRTITLIQPQIDAGKLSIEITPPANGTRLEVSAQVTDAAGNKSNIATDAAVIAIDPPGAPSVTIVEDANNDGYISAAELSGDIDVRIGLPATAQAGDLLHVSANGTPIAPITLSQDDIDRGNVDIALPNPGDGQQIVVNARVEDFAGNFGPSGSGSALIDITRFTGLAVTITEDANNDGFINRSELQDDDIDVRVTLPNGAAVGDTLTVTASGNINQVFTLTAAQLAAGFIDVKFNPTANNTDFVATASIADAAGNSAGPVSDQARIQLSAPGLPIVTITEDANNDGWINAAELQGDIDVSVTLPATAVAGAVLVTTVNGVVQPEILISQADINKGSIALPGIANPGEGTTLTVTAQVRDSAGNLGAIGSDSAQIDTRIPNDGHAPVVVIAEDANSDGLISASELQGNVDVRIEFDGSKVDVGDIVRVTDGTSTRNIEINDIDKANGFVTTDFPPLAAGQTITLRALIEDPAGNRSDEGWQSALFSLVKLDNIQVTVSEEGLAGGIPDPTGNPSDNTDDAFATGNIGVSGSGGVPLEVSVSAPPEAITSGGQALNWSGAGTTASPLIGYAGGSEVIRLSIDSDGNYRVTLAKPIDHADGQDENVATLNFNLSVSDGRTTANAVLTLAIEDDSPKAVPEAEGGAMRHQDTNILLIIDNSGSMAGSRIQILRDSVKQLIESYDMLGDVAVRIVVYNSSASAYTAGWVSASTAIAYVSTLGTGGATNYDAALLTAMQAFQSAGKIPGATNVSYFLSDGDPNARSDWDGSGPMANQVGIQPAEAAIWQAFLESNQINSFAFGMGTEVQQNSMAPVAYNGIDKTPTSAIVVSNERDLAPILRDTVNANFKGNFLDGSLHQGTGAGADGGHLNAFSIDGTSYFIDGSVNGSSAGSFEAATRKWTVFTQAGGKLVIDMDSGDYSYTPPIKDQATTEHIAFSIIDNDGDSASSTLALTVQPPPDKIMGGTGNDTLVGTAGDDYIDGDAGNDLIIGGAGADILKGGAGSDTFQWSFGDQGNVGLPAQDRITDFTLGSGGDVLDLRDLLQGENADNLTEYLHFSAVGNNTLLQISSQGQFSGSNHAAMSDQEILLHGVTLNSLAGAGATDAQIISELLKANLKVDL